VQTGGNHAYVLTRGLVVEVDDKAGKKQRDMKYESKYFPTKATMGQMVLRREGDEAICLAADSLTDSLREIERVPFTRATSRRVGLLADPGGSGQAMDTRITGLRIKAEEITGGIPERDQESNLTWWLLIGAVVVIGGGYAFWRWRRRSEEDE